MELTDQQIKSAHHFTGPALVLAVPGAGKTTVLLNRIENLIKNHDVKPYNILSITFSKTQALDMEERYFNIIGNRDKKNSPHFSTIHAFSYQIIRAYLKENLLSVRLIEGSDDYNKYSLVKSLYYKLNNDYISDEALEDFFTSLGYIKNTMLPIDEYLRESKSQGETFKKLYQEYENFKKEHHLIDFDDMLTMALNILKEDEKILRRIRNRYKFIQVDEAQDTSIVQLELIKFISSPLNNIFMVADDDQSIYSFRGASPKELLNFSKIYPDGKIFFMEENHRSDLDIVKVSNIFIQKNKDRYKKEITTRKDKSEPIKLVISKNSKSQYKNIVSNIKEELENHANLQIAILYRNNISSLGIINELEKENIGYKVRDKKKTLAKNFVVQDVLNILYFSKDPYNLAIFEKIYYKLNAYIKKDYLKYLGYNDNQELLDSLLDIPYLKDYQINKLINLKYSLRKIGSLDLKAAIKYIGDELGYSSYLEKRKDKLGLASASPEIVLELLKNLSEGLTCPSQLEEKINKLESPKREEFDEKVTLSTIHSSKGLEFDSVYLIDLVEGEFPSIKEYRSREDIARQMEEERRLFYVAMTRAKKVLRIYTLKTRNGKSVLPSLFFNEVKNMKLKKQKRSDSR